MATSSSVIFTIGVIQLYTAWLPYQTDDLWAVWSTWLSRKWLQYIRMVFYWGSHRKGQALDILFSPARMVQDEIVFAQYSFAMASDLVFNFHLSDHTYLLTAFWFNPPIWVKNGSQVLRLIQAYTREICLTTVEHWAWTFELQADTRVRKSAFRFKFWLVLFYYWAWMKV